MLFAFFWTFLCLCLAPNLLHVAPRPKNGLLFSVCWWWGFQVVGTTVFIVGSLLNFTAFAFAPQSVLASLEGIQVGALNLFRFCFFGCFFLSSCIRLLYQATLGYM